jgi:hypothetical protein
MIWGIDYDSFGVIVGRYTQDNPDLLKAFLSGYGFINDRNLQITLWGVDTVELHIFACG